MKHSLILISKEVQLIVNKKYNHLLETLLKDINDEKIFIKQRDLKSLKETMDKIEGKRVKNERI